jgi:trimeric autotransporter adhesin
VNGVAGTVTSFAYFGNRVIIGGGFSTLGDQTTPAKCVVAWDGTTFTSLGNGLGSYVKYMTVFGSRLFAAGAFTTLGDGTTSAKYIASWDGTSWSAIGPSGASNGLGGSVNTLFVFNSKLYIGGTFTALGSGTSAKYIASWDGSNFGTLAIGASNGVGGTVFSLAVYGGKLVVGYTSLWLGDGTTRANNIATWDGSAWATLGPSGPTNGIGLSGPDAMLVLGSKLYMTGGFWFTYDYAMNPRYFGAWDGSSFSVVASGGLSSSGYKMEAYGGNLVVGGNFDHLNDGSNVPRFVSYSPSNVWSFSSFASLSPPAKGFRGSISDFVMWSGKLYACGDFGMTMDGSVVLDRVASWDGRTWAPLTSSSGTLRGVGPSARALTVFQNKLVVGGSFSTLGDLTTQTARGLAWFDGTTWSGITGTGSVTGVPPGTFVNEVAVFQNVLYFGGTFTTLTPTGTSAKYIARFDGTSYSSLTKGASNGFSSDVKVMAVYSGRLYIGGSFNQFGDGTSANCIVSYDGTNFATLASGGSNGVNGDVLALAVFSGKLYVGGGFNALGSGTAANRIAAWDGSAWSTVGVGLGNVVYALWPMPSRLIVGGAFTTLGDGTTSAKLIASWSGSAWSTLPSGTSNGLSGIPNQTPPAAVQALVGNGSTIFVGGNFPRLGDGSQAGSFAWATV